MYDLKQNKRTAIPKEQLKALIDFIPGSKKDSRCFNIFLVLMFTGMRVSEMCALTWKDVDFDNDVIHINRSMAYTKNGGNKYTIIIRSSETTSGIRTIPMFIGFKSIPIQQKQSQEFFPPVSSGEYSDFVFGNKNNHPYTAEQVERDLKKL